MRSFLVSRHSWTLSRPTIAPELRCLSREKESAAPIEALSGDLWERLLQSPGISALELSVAFVGSRIRGGVEVGRVFEKYWRE